MADPLSQLRQFHINGREIKELNGYIIFGDYGWPKNVNTNYLVYSTEDEKSKKEYYTLECLLYFLKNVDLSHTHYVKEAGSAEIPAVHRPDRRNLIAYLKGEQQTSASIDKNAPIPPLRLPTADIYKKSQDHKSSGEPQPGTSSQTSNLSSQNDASAGGDNSNSASEKRKLEVEREKFAARLNNKKMATMIPADNVEKKGLSAKGSAALSMFSAEKIAAMKAKRDAVKRTTIIDADLDVGRSGTGATVPSKETDLLIAMDSGSSKLIKSKEKVWRTRSSILQAQSKNFYKTLLPLVNLLTKSEDPSKKVPGQMPPVPTDMQLNSYQQQQQHQQQQQQQQQHQQQQQQQQANQRNAYNRYDQERFVKLDIGVEIDTNKSFVSGVANGISVHNPSQQATSKPLANSVPTTNVRDGSSANHGRPIDQIADARMKPMYRKRTSVVPIIIIPATTTSLINMYNAAAILQDHTYVDGKADRPRESDILIQRKRPDGTHASYKILDNPLKLDGQDWDRVVAVFVQGPAWQFKGWPWNGSPVEIFARIKGFHLKWDETKLDDNVAKWNVHILELSRNKRHLDKANLLKFWSSLDNFMTKHKSFLRF